MKKMDKYLLAVEFIDLIYQSEKGRYSFNFFVGTTKQLSRKDSDSLYKFLVGLFVEESCNESNSQIMSLTNHGEDVAEYVNDELDIHECQAVDSLIKMLESATAGNKEIMKRSLSMDRALSKYWSAAKRIVREYDLLYIGAPDEPIRKNKEYEKVKDMGCRNYLLVKYLETRTDMEQRQVNIFNPVIGDQFNASSESGNIQQGKNVEGDMNQESDATDFGKENTITNTYTNRPKTTPPQNKKVWYAPILENIWSVIGSIIAAIVAAYIILKLGWT